MKQPTSKPIELEEIPNIGPAIATKLRRIGIEHPRQFIGTEPLQLYQQLNDSFGKKQDPCLLDVLFSAVYFMEQGEAKDWWAFTKMRKQILQAEERLNLDM